MLPTSSRRCPSNASPVFDHSPTAVAPALRTSKSSPTSSPTTSSLLLLLPRDRTLGKAETRLGLQTRAALVYSLIRDTPGSSLTFSSGFEVLRIFISHPFIPCLLCITTTGVPTVLLHPLMRIVAGRTRAPTPPNQPSTPVYSLIRCPGKAHPSRTINAHQPDVCDP